jgi:predicted flap endonuclease-1-like 5' DNA nuclease
MQYLIATYWVWFVVALLAGGPAGYWLPGKRIGEGGIRHRLLWGATACLAGLAAAVLHWFPLRAGVDLEPSLWLAFAFAIGGLLGRSLRAAFARAELARAALDSHAQVERAMLGARAKAAVKSGQDASVSREARLMQALSELPKPSQPKPSRPEPNRALENARLDVEAKAAEVMRMAAAAKAGEDERLGTAAKDADDARIAAAAKIQQEKIQQDKIREDKIQEDKIQEDKIREDKIREDKAREEERLAAEAKAAEEARQMAANAAAKAAAEKAAAEKAAEDARLAAEVKAADQLRLAAVARTVAANAAANTAEVSNAAVSKAATGNAADEVNARPAAETRAAEEARLAAAVSAVQLQHLAVEAKADQKARVAGAAARAAEHMEQPVAAAATRADASHPGRKPRGTEAPGEGAADDLKLIKGIGPRNEKACNALGITQFRQIADWTPDEAIWVGHELAFPGRVEREHWIAQARLLAAGVETEHSRAVKSGAITVDDKADEPLDPATAEMLGESLPEQAAPIDGERKHPGRRPPGLATALRKPDDLKRIRGIGPRNAGRLHELGIWHFAQVAAWTNENVKWVGSYLASSGRIQRDNWVAQARELAAGQETDKETDKEAGKENNKASSRRAAGKVAAPKDDGLPEEGSVQPPE